MNNFVAQPFFQGDNFKINVFNQLVDTSMERTTSIVSLQLMNIHTLRLIPRTALAWNFPVKYKL
jgi:hypothetical protein